MYITMLLKPGSIEHRIHFARFVNSSYNKTNDIPEGYLFDPELSNRNRQFYVNPETKHVVMSMPGTRLNLDRQGLQDLGIDLMLAYGMEKVTPRFRNAKKWAKKAQAKYGSEFKYTATGHSMSGSIANYLTDQLGWESVSYSAHTPTNRIANEMLWMTSGVKAPKNSYNYSTLADPIALGTIAARYHTGNMFIVPQKTKDPHSLKNYL